MKKKEEPYAQIVVSLPWHDKVCDMPEEARAAAFGLYCASVCFCQDKLTDGRIRRVELAKVFPVSDAHHLADVLIGVGLFDQDAEAYYVHDYLDWNRSREEVLGLRSKRIESGRAGGLANARANAKAKSEQTSSKTLPISHLSYTEQETSPCRPFPVENPKDVHPGALGKLEEKLRRVANQDEIRSLRSLSKKYSDGVVCHAISQAFVQINEGSSSVDNLFGLITTIAKKEAV